MLWQVCISFLSISNQFSSNENWYTCLLAMILEALSEWCFKLIPLLFLLAIVLVCLSSKLKLSWGLRLHSPPFWWWQTIFLYVLIRIWAKGVFSPWEDFSPYGEKDLKACSVKTMKTNNHKVLLHPSPPLTLSKRRERCNKKL